MIAVFFFGKSILALFGREFVEGYTALCIIAVASCIWTMVSLSPAYLQYVKRQRFVIVGRR